MGARRHQYDEVLRRVRPDHPCPICGRTDWCAYTTYLVYCMREPTPAVGWQVRPHPSGGWIHTPPNDHPVPIPNARREGAVGGAARRRVRAARVELRDRWYRTLLNTLHLNPDHQAQLLGRGLSEQTVWARRYRSLPPTGRIELCKRVLRIQAGEPIGVPGFYQHPRTQSWIFAGAAGLLIPVVDRAGLIQGLQVRRDRSGTDGNRYCWVSSLRKGLNGSSPGAPVHVARPVGVEVYDHPEVVWITEGPLKADRLAQGQRDPALAIPGVAARSGVLEEIRHHGVQWAVVAFDMDQYQNVQVAHHLRQLCSALASAGLKVAVASWDTGYKGIDDALEAGVQIRVRRWKTAA